MFLKKWYYTYFSKNKDFYQKLESILGFTPSDFKIYKLAFSHKSITKKNNERLEFLGDSILDAVISNILFHKFEKKLEGELSKLRSKLVNRKMLNSLATKMDLMPMLDYNRKLSNINESQTNMSGNTLEALIGAVYLDKGYSGAYKFIEKKVFLPYINWHEILTEVVDFKSLIFSHCQKTDSKIDFITINDSSLRRNDRFEVAILVNDVELARGIGKNKKIAHQAASKNALKKLEKLEI